MKFQLNDIVIKTPGVQIRERIVDKYGSIKIFSEEIQLYETSIEQYLSSKKLGSSTFKIRMMNAFKMDFRELYKSYEEQIRYFTSMLSLHIDKYVFKDDIKILEKLKMIALEYELYEDYAIVCRAYAHFYMNQGKYDRAKAYIDVAVNSVRDRNSIDRYGLYLGDQIFIKSKAMTKVEFKKSVEEFYGALPRVKDVITKGKMHMKLGEAYFNLDLFHESKIMFEKVLDYHKDARSRSFVYMWLGDIEKKLGNMDKSFSYYKQAEKLLNAEDVMVYYVYDEYALYYLNRGNIEKAEKYVDMIIQVKTACKKESEIIEVINRLLVELEDGYIYSFHHFNIAGDLLRNTILKGKVLRDLMRNIINFYRNHDIDNEEVKLIEVLLGSIALNKKFDYI